MDDLDIIRSIYRSRVSSGSEDIDNVQDHHRRKVSPVQKCVESTLGVSKVALPHTTVSVFLSFSLINITNP